LALTHLDGIAQAAPSPALREEAGELLERVARGAGLTPEELADRQVPDLGLGPDGGLLLDLGARTFSVGFDEALRPHLVTGPGPADRADELPAPAAGDDPA